MKFGVTDGFHVELRRRVETFFRTTGRRPRDCWQIYVKTGILVAVLVASYLLLLFAAFLGLISRCRTRQGVDSPV
jgi:linoleoyl-CoA desaturase